MTITLQDVARAAGVSPSTVSRIMNGTAEVAQGKRTRVLEVIDRLGYHPNVAAQSLKTGQSMTIGILTQELDSLFYGKTLKGIEIGLAHSGYHPLFVGGHWQAQDEITSLETLLRRRVDALIVIGGQTPDAELERLSKRLPLMVVSRTIKGLENQCLCINNEQAAFEATEYLYQLGHRRIAHVAGPLEREDTQERLAGYRRSLESHGEFDQNLVLNGDYSEQSGLLAVESLLTRNVRFSAIFTGNDQMAHGARLALYRRGIRVPEDVSLMGFDDLPTTLYSIPPLSTVRQPMLAMGEMAAKHILALLEHRPQPSTVCLHELIIRESTTLLR
jgi:LacI family transcriptional regulator